MLELSEETSQQLATLAAYHQRPMEEMLRLCLRAYEQYQYHLVHQQMIAEELLEALPPLRALGAADEADDDFGARQPFVQGSCWIPGSYAPYTGLRRWK
jgi:hypothetical protein